MKAARDTYVRLLNEAKGAPAKENGTRDSIELRNRAGESFDRDDVIQMAIQRSIETLKEKSPFSPDFDDYILGSTDKTIPVLHLNTASDLRNAKLGHLRDSVRTSNSIFKGDIQSSQSGMRIVVGNRGIEETANNAENQKKVQSVKALSGLDSLLETSVLVGTAETNIDENAPTTKKNNPQRLFQYILVSPFVLDEQGKYLAIIRIDVLNDDIISDFNKFYNLNSIEITEASGDPDFIAAFNSGPGSSKASKVSIADLALAVNSKYLGNQIGVGHSQNNEDEPIRNSYDSPITPEEDTEYMDAVESGDMETAQRMVDEAAERAMPDSKVRDEALEDLEGTPEQKAAKEFLFAWKSNYYKSVNIEIRLLPKIARRIDNHFSL